MPDSPESPLRPDPLMAPVRLGSLAQLDALVGQYVAHEQPHTYWQDSWTNLEFNSVEEAIEALHDPFFRGFVPAEDRTDPVVLTEVHEFRPYSTDLDCAWLLVTQLATTLHFRVRADECHAAFGDMPPVSAATAPLAICLAALRLRGIHVELSAALVKSVRGDSDRSNGLHG